MNSNNRHQRNYFDSEERDGTRNSDGMKTEERDDDVDIEERDGKGQEKDKKYVRNMKAVCISIL